MENRRRQMTLSPLNHKRLSSTSRMVAGRMEANIEGLAQSCLRLLNAAFHHREYLNSANPESAAAEFLATAAKTSILVKFFRPPLDLSGTDGISLTA